MAGRRRVNIEVYFSAKVGTSRGCQDRTPPHQAPAGCARHRGQDQEIYRDQRQRRPGDGGLQGRHHRRRRRQARRHPGQGPARQRHHLQRVPPAQGVRPAGRASRSRTAPTSFIAPKLRDAALRGGGAARGARLLPQAQPAFRQGAAVPAADRRVLPQDQGQELEGQAARRRRSADAVRGRRQADPAVQSGQADRTARSRSWCCRPRTCSAATTSGSSFPR